MSSFIRFLRPALGLFGAAGPLLAADCCGHSKGKSPWLNSGVDQRRALGFTGDLGRWQLEITTCSGGAVGSLMAWSLIVDYSEPTVITDAGGA